MIKTVNVLLAFMGLCCGSLLAQEAKEAQVNLIEVNAKLQKSARDLGKKLFPLVVKNDVKGITELHVSAEDVKELVANGVFDIKRLQRDFESGKGSSPEEMKKAFAAPGFYKKLETFRRSRVAKRYGRIVEKAAEDGVDLSKAKYVDTEIASLHMRQKESYSLAADINLVIEVEGKKYTIQLDDCILSKRGWVLVDGFRWLTVEEN